MSDTGDSDFVAGSSSDEEETDPDLVEEEEEEEDAYADFTSRPKKKPVKVKEKAKKVAAKKVPAKPKPAPKGKGKRKRKEEESGGDEAGARKTGGQGLAGGIEYFACELAKSSRSACRRCDNIIKKGELKVGAVCGEGRWGKMTSWHHLACSIIKCDDPSDVVGFDDLEAEKQEELTTRWQESKDEVDDLYEPIQPDDLVRKEWTQRMDSPSELTVPLLQYQEEGLGWMYHQETSEHRGGILADEMGMGKTCQAISVILANKPNPRNKKLQTAWDAMEKEMEREPDKAKRGGTLVICPLIAMHQWKSEIEKFTKEGTLKVLIHHGSKRTSLSQDLTEVDVVITTYSIAEAEYRRVTAGSKVQCPECGKKLQPDKFVLHRKYFCGKDAKRTAGQAKAVRKREEVSDSESDDDDDGSTDPPKTKGKAKAKAKGKSVANNGKGKSKGKKAVETIEIDDDDKVTELPGKGGKVGKAVVKSRKNGKNATEGEEDESATRPAKKARGGKKKEAAKVIDLTGSDGEAEVTVLPKSGRGKGGRAVKGKKAESDEETTVLPKKGKGRGKKTKDAAESDEETTVLPTKGKGKGKGKKAKVAAENDEETTVLPKKGKGRGKKAKAAAESDEETTLLPKKGKGKGRKTRAAAESDEETTVLPKRGKGKGKGKKGNSGKGNGKKRGGSGSNSDSDASIEDSDSGEENLPAGLEDLVHAHAEGTSVLHDISWFRIILDEAHMIKDRSCSTAKSVFALTSLHKWCLTGTPLQNRVGELYSLIRFLRMDPHAYYMCRTKGCDCKSLHYRFGPLWKACVLCNHSPMQHYSLFNKEILNPIQRCGYIGEGKKGFIYLKNQILDKIMLRRTKETRSKDICLPLKLVKVKHTRLSETEEDFYQAVYTQSQAKFNTYADQGVATSNFAHIFDLLCRLRQAVDHPYLVVYSGKNASATATSTTLAEADDEACAVCNEPPENPVVAGCGHYFCRTCVEELMDTAVEGAELECPDCSEPLSVNLTQSPAKKAKKSASSSKSESSTKARRKPIPAGKFFMSTTTAKSIINRIDLSKFQTSTKMEALMQELHAMRLADPAAKAIVFSQFVNYLDLVEYRIKLGGIDCVKLSGHMSADQRESTLDRFRNDPNCSVILISLKAGGVALNLTVANRVFVMDLWWNPASEHQAIDRTHRMGQYKPVYATRFVVENTIEERILKLQEKKELVFQSTVGGSAASLSKLTVDDLRFLFQ